MNLREIRKEKGLTQESLARATSIKRTSIANYETGYREPNIGALRKLSKALDCTIDELIGDDPEEKQGACELA